ncbi:unnamed protein product [Acanthoscelides obtectus]|uniref:Uncharacterized protein n=1 Tax=Acanthoscelides obtectus TaxID=200917 RepID=A0A9P0PHR3_ACAOB|nr:unnamed protein product [Acanthoscelides obtectus]CAK1676855.1 hypothetical protein AOBTE_LOCUS30974 [Acanthoscelides obtectus]
MEAKDSSRLQAVFSKLSGVLPISREDLRHHHYPKTMSSDIIESVLSAANDTPLPQVPTNWNQNDVSNNANTCGGSVTGLTGEGGAATPGNEEVDCQSAVIVNTLAQRLETELRRAKRTHLACGEVLWLLVILPRIYWMALNKNQKIRMILTFKTSCKNHYFVSVSAAY